MSGYPFVVQVLQSSCSCLGMHRRTKPPNRDGREWCVQSPGTQGSGQGRQVGVGQKVEGVHQVPNLLTLGRHGLFLNNSMDDNVLLGMKVADHIRTRGFDSATWLSEMLAFMHLRFQGK